MTLKVYIIHNRTYHDGTFEKKVEEIKKLNPDKILIVCLEEGDAKYIFYDLFPKLCPYLLENNKIAKLLIINPDKHEYAPNVITEKTFGYQFCLKGTIDYSDSLNIDFTQSHTFATKLYTCYNYVNKFHRAITLDLLAKENLIDDGVITCHNPDNIQTDYSGIHYTFRYYDKQVRKDEEDYDRFNAAEFDGCKMAKSFLKGFVDIATETQYCIEQPFVTEKTVKSISALKPFLSVSSYKFHEYMEKEYGIEPYPELFDYSFDSLPNIYGRANGVVQNIKRIKPIFENEYEKNKIHDLLLPRMIENKKRLYEYTFNKEKMIPPSLQFMTETNNYQLFGDVIHCEDMFNFYKNMNWIKI